MIAAFRHRIMQIATSKSLSARAAQSGVWVGIGFVGQRGLQFVSNLILTRLLFPEAFGIMALATVFLVGLAMFSDIGLKPAIIRDPRSREPTFLNTAWTIQIIRGFGIFAVGSLLAYPASIIYDEPILTPLLIVMSSTAAIAGFQTVGLATSERDLDFSKPTFVALTGQIINIIVLVSLAWYWRSVWALAVGNVIGAFATVVIGHCVLNGHRHRIAFEKSSAQSIVRFGRWIMVSTVVTFLGGEGLRAVQAGLLTLSEFGVLSIAYAIAVIATDLPTKLFAAIGLPALVEASGAGFGRLAKVLWKIRARVLIIAVPLAILAALISNPIIELLYDNRYHDAGRYVALLILSNAVWVVASGYTAVLLAIGDSKSNLYITCLLTTTRIIAVISGYKLFGITGMLLGIGLANLSTLIFTWFIPSLRSFVSAQLDLLAVAVIAAPILMLFSFQ